MKCFFRAMQILHKIFTFFYINRRKCWFRANFRFPVLMDFDGCPEHEWDIFGKCMSFCLCVCDKNFVASLARELMNRIHETLYLVSPQHKLGSINFWWKSFNRWRCNQTFSRFLGMRRSWLLLDEIKQKFTYKIYTTRKKDGTIFEHMPHKGALQFCFLQNSLDSHISVFVAWNCSKF